MTPYQPIADIAGGFRQLLDRDIDRARQSHVLGYGYFGYYFELDAHRWFALPFGLYPFNPTQIKAREDTDLEIAWGWSFPSSVEVGFNF